MRTSRTTQLFSVNTAMMQRPSPSDTPNFPRPARLGPAPNFPRTRSRASHQPNWHPTMRRSRPCSRLLCVMVLPSSPRCLLRLKKPKPSCAALDLRVRPFMAQSGTRLPRLKARSTIPPLPKTLSTDTQTLRTSLTPLVCKSLIALHRVSQPPPTGSTMKVRSKAPRSLSMVLRSLRFLRKSTRRPMTSLSLLRSSGTALRVASLSRHGHR
mmetsp:Transcript_7786/g.15438  ORF Transcript_7786/g.15438 Transcript_7786/m.15438 type:complete len:211 (+) Transcript_7786:790-1422(+)